MYKKQNSLISAIFHIVFLHISYACIHIKLLLNFFVDQNSYISVDFKNCNALIFFFFFFVTNELIVGTYRD